jgi:predicted permease
VSFWKKLRALLPWYRAAQEREMQEELESLKAIAGRNELGNLTLVAEDARSTWRWNWLETLGQDVRYSLRTLRKSPGFTITAVAVLSIGIGLNLTFFQLLNVTFFKPLPVRDAASLVQITLPAGVPLNYAAMDLIRANNNVFSAVLKDMRITAPEHQVTWEEDPLPIGTFFVSANWFDELGVKPLRGRLLRESTDAGVAADPVAVVSEHYWETYLERSPAVVGANVRLSGKAVTIVGVVPRGQGHLGAFGTSGPGIWLPVEQIPYLFPEIGLSTALAEGGAWGNLYGRLRPGVSLAAATEGLRPVLNELGRQQPSYARVKSAALYSGSTRFRTPRTTTRILGSVAIAGSFTMLILLISCANLANLVLSRTISRLQELSVRVSLGASRARVLRHLLTETALVAVLASGVGLFMAYGGMRIALVVTGDTNTAIDLSLDWRTLAVAFAGTIFMTAFVGLLPAWTIGKRDLALAMRDGGEQASYSLSRVRQRQLLLAAQVAGSCLLLVVAGLMLRTLQKKMTPPGFDAENVLAAERPGVEGDTAQLYWKNLRDHIAQQPGIESVALSRVRPGDGNISRVGFADFPDLKISLARVSPEFFQVMRVPFLTGRPYDPSDVEGQAIVLSKSLALRVFGTVDVVGRPFPNNGHVTGVVSDVRLRRSEEAEQLVAYAPLGRFDRAVVLARVRTSADAGKLVYTLPASLRLLDARIPSIYLLERTLNDKIEEAQITSTLLSSLGALALAVACMGIFGVISYNVALRRKEIGIRLALGALDRSIVVLMLRQLIWPVSLAIIAGLIGGVAVGIAFASEGDFSPVEAPVVAAALIVLLAAIGFACIVPTLRALRSADNRVLSS